MPSIHWLLLFALVAPGFAGQAPVPQPSAEEARVFKIFTARVQQYIKLQKDVEASLPALKPTKEVARIAEHEHALARKIAQARRGARQGDIFTDEVTRQFRRIIRGEFQGPEGPACAQDDPPGRPVQGHCSSACERRLPGEPPVDDHAADFVEQAASTAPGTGLSDRRARPDAEGHESRFDCGSHPERHSLRLSMMPAMRRAAFFSSVALAALGLSLHAQELTLPLKPNSVRFAVIGDMGTGEKPQYELAGKLVEYRQKFPFEFVITLGDNIYDGDAPRDYESKFERPYKPLLDAGVKFYAALGNHDKPNERFYKPFNMNGQQYYTLQEGQRPLLRSGQQLHEPEAARVAGDAAAERRVGLEDLLFPSSALFFRGLPWLIDRAPPCAGTPLRKIRGAGRLRRARPRL